MAKTATQIREEMRARKQASAPVQPIAEEPKALSNGAAEHEPTAESRQIVPQRTFPPANRVRRDEQQKELPHSLDAEQGILGCMIRAPAFSVPIVTQRISASHFYSPNHQLIFADLVNSVADLGLEGSQSLDLVVLEDYFKGVGHLEKIGGPVVLRSLFVDAADPAILTHHVDILVESYQRRELIHTTLEIARRAGSDIEDMGALLLLAQGNVERVIGLADKRVARLPELRDLSTMLGESKPARPLELVKNVLHQGSKLIVGGTSKGRKTYSLLDLAVSVATGHSWWGFDCNKGPVCYINFEIQESFFCERVETICEKKGVKLDPKMLMGWNLRGHGEGIERMVEELMAILLKKKFVLIIFDPIYKALGDRDENKAGDVASMLNELERIAVKTGAAIAFGAHYSKGNQAAKESIDRIGGSGVFARDPDSILTMTAHDEEDAFTVDATLRNFRPLEPFVVKWEWPIFQREPNLDPEALKQPRKRSGEYSVRYSKEMLLEELSIIDGVRPGKLLKRLGELQGISRAQFYRFAKTLRDAGQLKEVDGFWFRSSSKQP